MTTLLLIHGDWLSCGAWDGLDDRFEKVPKHYIQCMADRAMTPQHQDWMASRYTIKSKQQLNTGHMAAYAAPGNLADALLEVVTMENSTG